MAAQTGIRVHACATVDGPRNIGGVYAGGVGFAISRTRTLVCLAAINNAIKHEFVRLSRATKGGRISPGKYSLSDPTSTSVFEVVPLRGTRGGEWGDNFTVPRQSTEIASSRTAETLLCTREGRKLFTRGKQCTPENQIKPTISLSDAQKLLLPYLSPVSKFSFSLETRHSPRATTAETKFRS